MKLLHRRRSRDGAPSLPVRGAWVEMLRQRDGDGGDLMSLPVRGAWVEINLYKVKSGTTAPSLPVRGAWVEIPAEGTNEAAEWRRSPCGERGLKSPSSGGWCGRWWSLPVRGAWVEMVTLPRIGHSAESRSPCGERGLKCIRPR